MIPEMNVRPRILVVLLLAVSLLGGCRSAQIGPDTVTEANTATPALAGALPATPILGSIDYRVGGLDVLEIEVFGAEALTRSVRVSESGEITLPLIGRVRAAGFTVSELETEIARRLQENYLENPQVTVFVKEYMSQRITVEGAVREPGIYSLTGRTSLLQVIALSNGLDELANPKGIVVYRNLDGKRYAAAFDIREIRAGRMVDPEVLGNDIVVVDYSGARSGLKDFLYTVPLLALFVVI
jgi:polysaccharide export outer membrane protein